jgi:hypothetical protein
MTFYAWKPDYKAGDRFVGGAGQRVSSRAMSALLLAHRGTDPAITPLYTTYRGRTLRP